MDSAPTALARCIGDVDHFLTEDWGRRPRHMRGADEQAFADLLPLADVDAIICSMALRTPAFRLVRDGSPVPERDYVRGARIGSRPIADLIDVGKVGALFAAGATIVLQGVQRYWPAVTAFCRELEESLTHAVQANAYITPPGSSGFDVHADRHDVFALQTHGRKRWVVHPPDGGEAWDLELAAGGCLYLPKGVRHAAQTIRAPSVHLTIGVRHTTWRDVVERAARDALADPALDEALPAGFAADPNRLVPELRERLNAVATSVTEIAETAAGRAAADAAERFWAARVPPLRGHIQDLLDLEDMDEETSLVRRPGAVCVLREQGDDLVVILGDRDLRMPAWTAPAVRSILGRTMLRPADLGEHLDASSRLVLARRLVREGLLMVHRA